MNKFGDYWIMIIDYCEDLGIYIIEVEDVIGKKVEWGVWIDLLKVFIILFFFKIGMVIFGG